MINPTLGKLTSLCPPSGESPVSSVSSTVTTALIQAKPSSNSQQDRKVPPPIGTERLARIRQTGSVNHAMLTASYTPPVGQGGIWSFGVGSASGEFWREVDRVSVQL